MAGDLKHWQRRIIKVLVLFELAYVVLVNTALQLPYTQSRLNQLRPEKFHISWQDAWSWYPFRVHIEGGFANGQSRKQQWQFSAARVSASISILPLLFKRVWISDVDAVDIDYRQRPRLRADKDYADDQQYFPDIEGWDISEADLSPLPARRPWYVSIDDISLIGDHSVWFHQFRGALNAAIEADLEVRNRGGPFELDIESLNINMNPVYYNGSHEVLRAGSLRGSMGFSEFVPRETPKIDILGFLRLDVEADLDVNSLAFIDLFLLNFEGVTVDGRGKVAGDLKFAHGEVLAGTDITVDAEDLNVNVMALKVAGNGSVNLSQDQLKNDTLDIRFGFENLQITHQDDITPMLEGQDLVLTVGTGVKIAPRSERALKSRSLSASIGGLNVPDLALLQRYLPEKWPFQLHGGSGELRGSVDIMPTSLAVDLQISSDDADMAIKQYRFDTDLDFSLKLDNPSVQTRDTDVSGTYFRLSDAQLVKDGFDSSKPAEVSITLNEGFMSLFDAGSKANAGDLLSLMSSAEARQLLGAASGKLGFDAQVSSLSWLGVLLGKDQHTSVSGQGDIQGSLHLEAGMPAPGTDIEVNSGALKVNILDYTASGDGRIGLLVEEGGDRPDWRVNIDLAGAGLMRKNESVAVIRDVAMKFDALLEDVSFEEKGNPYTLDLRILSARVTDMSAFNHHFPPDAPVSFGRGVADLSADIKLQTEDARGWVKLNSSDVEIVLDQQVVGADLDVAIALNGGIPADMEFDITGSTLVFNNVRVIGEDRQFDEQQWQATVELRHGTTTWKTPVRIDLDATLRMSDSRPFAALFRNEGSPNWLANMMTVEDITGSAELNLSEQRLIIPYAWAESDKILLGAKGVIEKPGNTGVFFLKYKALGALLKVTNGKRNLDLINVRKKFDEYQVGQ